MVAAYHGRSGHTLNNTMSKKAPGISSRGNNVAPATVQKKELGRDSEGNTTAQATAQKGNEGRASRHRQPCSRWPRPSKIQAAAESSSECGFAFEATDNPCWFFQRRHNCFRKTLVMYRAAPEWIDPFET